MGWPRSPRRGLLAAALWSVPFAAGIALRVWNLPAQILGGDEVQALRSAVAMPLPAILTTYQARDNCIPLTALFHLLLAAGAPVGEVGLRLPVLVCGLLALAAIPLAVAWRLGRPAGYALAWLVALSPLLVLYSRIVRPYLPIVLFSFLAAAAFEAWWRTGRRRYAAVYVAFAGLSGFFHLASAPFVVAPLVFAAGDLLLGRLRRPRADPSPCRRPGWRALAAVAAALGAAFLAFLLPARSSLLALVGDKRAPFEVTGRTVAGVLELEAGSGRAGAAAAFWLVALLGLALLFRRDRRLGAYTLTLVAVQCLGLLALSPEMLGHPLVLDRYLLPILPWVLAWAAVGLTEPWPGRALRRGLRAGLAALLVAGLALAGPLPGRGFLASSFLGHNDFVAFFCPRSHPAPGAVPVFYREILRRETDAPVLEFPFIPLWIYDHAYYAYQGVHGQEVLVGLVEPLPELRFRLRNSVPPAPRDFLASRARYLAVHTDLLGEEERLGGHCWPLVARMKPRDRRLLANSGRRMAGWLVAQWGPPDLRDGTIEVWDLSRLRRHLQPAGPDLMAMGGPRRAPPEELGQVE
jgi:hypothetical protein